MITFEEFWQLLYDHGSRNYYKNDTWARWNELTPKQQQALYNTINTKIRTGKFVDYNPLEAIHDNLTRKSRPTGEPTNYNGARSFPNEPLVRAIYTNQPVQSLSGSYGEATFRRLPSGKREMSAFIGVLP